MTVKELKFILEDKNDDVNIVFMSALGMKADVSNEIVEDFNKDQMVIYIK